MKDYKQIAIDYANAMTAPDAVCGAEVAMAARRFLDDLKRTDLELHEREPNFVCSIIERTMVHRQGDSIEGEPLLGKPFILQPWQVFVIYNLIGLYKAGTNERKYHESLIYIPRKNGKTAFIAALSWALSLLERRSGSKIYIVAGSLKQANEAFADIVFSLKHNGMAEEFRIRNSYAEHMISGTFHDKSGEIEGSIDIEALAANPDAQDSFNCNIAIADEIQSYKKPAQYNRFKEAMKAYTNKLMIGITTAGDNTNSFCYEHLQYCLSVVSGRVQDDTMFAFIARADQGENGDVDYTNPIQHQKANPSYGVTIRPADIMNEAMQALNSPVQRKDFLSRSLNIYTSAMRAYFDTAEFQASDAKYNWTLAELAKLPIQWFGGADLSKLHDLTAAALFGNYKGVDIIIPHAFAPVVMAHKKADEDNIPIFGWADSGELTLCNTPTVNHADVVKWFVDMRAKGFRIKQVGHDRKFCREYFVGMKAAKFTIVDQPQYFYKKSEGFRYIEQSAKNGKLYYLHSAAFLYCVGNVAAVEKAAADDMVQFEKINEHSRIDIFDASVFACVRYLENLERSKTASAWFGENLKEGGA